jgi:hypothetical protein
MRKQGKQKERHYIVGLLDEWIGFRCGEEIIEDCYDPIDDYAVPLIIDRPIRF